MNSPAEIAQAYVPVGAGKTRLSIGKMLLLGILAGMFIALAGVAATFGNVYCNKVVGACIFPAGLAMVVLAGSELFTGNNLIIISVLEKQATLGGMLKNWVVVYIGNLIGSVLVSALCAGGGVFQKEEIACAVVATATAKVSMSFGAAVCKGILCNFLVCIAVWMGFAAKTAGGKIAMVFFPIMAFVVSGFEHSVANMFYLSAGIFTGAQYSGAFAGMAYDTGVLNVGSAFLNNLVPVTIGNIIGGSILCGCMYWLIYLRKKA